MSQTNIKMEFLYFIFVFLIGVHTALIRTKKSTNNDGFVLENRPHRNNENSQDSYVLSGPAKNRNNQNKDSFVLTASPNSDKKDNTKYVKPKGAGTFWHLTDLHLDFYYNQNNEEKTVCPSSNGYPVKNPGPYGDYRCDSPWKLVNASIYAMKEIHPTPDFILWTGDDTLHTNDEDKYVPEDQVFLTIKNVTDLIRKVFPQTDVYPALGNHDFYPKNQMPVGRSSFLESIGFLWNPWLDDAAYEAFKDGGFYTTNYPKTPNLEIFVLNTNIWYSSNKLVNVTYDSDPGGQFAFLRSVLNRAVEDDTKVYIVGHIPPGYFELVDYKNWLYPIYNSKYIELVKEYSQVIAGQFFGHHHTDSFRIFRHEGKSVSTAWISPGVSPWMTSLPGVVNGANNPGIRLFEYDPVSLKPTDYVQFYLDLEKANNDGTADWKVEYRATKAYEINDISHASMDTLYKNLKSADINCKECPENKLLQKYYLYNSVSYNTNYCDRNCQRLHTCAISQLEEKGYLDCINGAGITLKANQLWLFVVSAILITASWN